MSDEDNNGQKEPTGDDTEGGGAPPVETLTPNPIKLLPLLPRVVDRRKNVLHLGLSTNQTKLQLIK
jgi:hypothetical protein